MKLKTQWLLLALFTALPYFLLGIAGAWWLFDSGWGLWWMVGTALVSLSGWPLMRRLRKRSDLSTSRSAGPADDWSPAGQAAWAEVLTIAERLDSDDDVMVGHPDQLIALAREVVEKVARQFHAGSINPLFEVPVPQVLQIVELVARDVRHAVSANIPGSHILTINDLIRIKKVVRVAPTLFRLYRLVALFVSPTTALARELNAMAQEQILNASTDETRRWGLKFAVRRTGFYAIELFSGHLMLRGVEFAGYSTDQSRQAIAGEQHRMTVLENEPLRILIIGQVKAGKSSLVNAMFGQIRAAVDVVPRTKRVEPFLLERDGVPRAIILDTAGYDDVTQTAEALDLAREEIVKCDLVVVVSSAETAARNADRQLLDDVRGMFQNRPDQPFPPLVVALTRIDKLRPFREWNPPYDLTQPEGTKARQIREAVEATAIDLAVDVERVIPVCLLEGNLYNVEDGLIPAILSFLSAAQRLKYLRCLREFKDEEYWLRLRQQAANTGRILLKTGLHLLETVGRSFPKSNGDR